MSINNNLVCVYKNESSATLTILRHSGIQAALVATVLTLVSRSGIDFALRSHLAGLVGQLLLEGAAEKALQTKGSGHRVVF